MNLRSLFCFGLMVALSLPLSHAEVYEKRDVPSVAATPVPTAGDPEFVDDDFNPGLGLFVLFAAVVCLILVGVGIAVGCVLIGLSAIMLGLGVLSTSTAIAIFKRKPGAGIRALIIQLSTLAGIPCGIALFWIGRHLTQVQFNPQAWVIWGAACGAASGFAVALLLNFAWTTITQKITKRFALPF